MLDFQGFVERRNGDRVGGIEGGGHAYSYVSDRNTRLAFERMKPIELVIQAGVRYFRASLKGKLLGSAIRVGPKQFPRVHYIAQRCAESLGIAVPTVYIVSSPVMNAGTYGTPDESFILVHSALLEQFNDEELLFVLGHECGHMHNNHVVYLTAMHMLAQLAGLLVPRGADVAKLPLSGWMRRAEITCDRAGLLCGRDLKAATTALTKLAIGSAKLHAELNVEEFLSQHKESQESIGRYAELSASHPWLPKRVLALRVFAESEMYRKQMGDLGGIDMPEVDEKVHQIIRVLG